MPNYAIEFSLTAKDDIKDTYNYIAYVLFEPLTAEKYIEGLYKAIGKLKIYGGSIAPNPRVAVQKRYGPNARTITYKKMTIIFNLKGNMILIRRVMASSLII